MRKQILLLVSILTTVALQAQNVQTASNGLFHTPTTGTAVRVVGLGGTLTQATTVDMGASFTLGFKKGSTNYFHIGNNGNIGLGTITPANKLSIAGATATNTGLQLVGLTNASTSTVNSTKALAVDASGNIIWVNVASNFSNGVTGILPISNGGTGLGSLGTANQQLRINAAGTAWEYFTPAPTNSTPAFNNGLTTSNGAVRLGGALANNTTISNMDSTLTYKFNDGSFVKTGNLRGYTGTMEQYGKGRYQVYNERSVSDKDWWNVNFVIDTVGKTYSVLATENYEVKFSAGKFTSFDGYGPFPKFTGATTCRAVVNAHNGFLIDIYGKAMLFNINLEGKMFLYKSPQEGTSADSILVWDASTKAIKKIAQTGITGGSSSTWSTNGTTLYSGNTGFVGIGTAANPAPGDANVKLAVNGNIYAKKLKVTLSGWADYVFAKNYQLPSLPEVEKYIQQHQHLPEVPSAAAVAKNGIDVGENQTILLKKIEELTLYLINQNKQLAAQQQQINALKQQVNKGKK